MGEPWEPMLIAPPAAASSHLSDGELFTANTPGQVKHLADCAWCSHRQDAASAGVAAEADDEDFEQALRAGQWRDEFKHASREAVLPDQVRALMTAPGISWRCRARSDLAAHLARPPPAGGSHRGRGLAGPVRSRDN